LVRKLPNSIRYFRRANKDGANERPESIRPSILNNTNTSKIKMRTTIDPKILHKSSSDDVLITDPTVPLPEYVDAVAMQKCKPELQQLLALYKPHDAGCLRFSGSCNGAEISDVEKQADRLQDGQRWLKLRAVPYQIVHAALRADRLKEDTAKLLEALQLPRRSSSYTFLNDASHYFFYRKTHDHVPGIMLIEAQRQAIYHHLYSNYSWVLGQVSVSLNSLQAVFYDYANLMYPIEIVVDDLAAVPSQKPRKFCFRVSFYQKAKMVAAIDSDATVIPIDNYKRIRNTFMHAGEWFQPIENLISCRISPLSPHGAHVSELEVKLLEVSKTGIRFIPATAHPAPGEETMVKIANSDGKTFSAKAVFETVSEKGSSWRFKDVESDKLLMLGMIIASGCISPNFSSAHNH
jgi:hypothetical protein